MLFLSFPSLLQALLCPLPRPRDNVLGFWHSFRDDISAISLFAERFQYVTQCAINTEFPTAATDLQLPSTSQHEKHSTKITLEIIYSSFLTYFIKLHLNTLMTLKDASSLHRNTVLQIFSNLASRSRRSLTSSRSELEFDGGSEVAAATAGKTLVRHWYPHPRSCATMDSINNLYVY